MVQELPHSSRIMAACYKNQNTESGNRMIGLTEINFLASVKIVMKTNRAASKNCEFILK